MEGNNGEEVGSGCIMVVGDENATSILHQNVVCVDP